MSDKELNINDQLQEDSNSNRPMLRMMASITQSGPLPPASEIEKYEKTLKGSADRIISMAEKEQNHRHEQEILKNRSDISLSNKGLVIGSLFEVSLIGGLVYSIFLDNLPGIITLGACVLALPVVFILRQSFKKITLFGNSIEIDDDKED